MKWYGCSRSAKYFALLITVGKYTQSLDRLKTSKSAMRMGLDSDIVLLNDVRGQRMVAIDASRGF
jgi:hypothetical protein